MRCADSTMVGGHLKAGNDRGKAPGPERRKEAGVEPPLKSAAEICARGALPAGLMFGCPSIHEWGITRRGGWRPARELVRAAAAAEAGRRCTPGRPLTRPFTRPPVRPRPQRRWVLEHPYVDGRGGNVEETQKQETVSPATPCAGRASRFRCKAARDCLGIWWCPGKASLHPARPGPQSVRPWAGIRGRSPGRNAPPPPPPLPQR